VALGILKRSGYTDIVTADNGRRALDLIASRGGIDQFDLILMDLHMPVMVRRSLHRRPHWWQPYMHVWAIHIPSWTCTCTKDPRICRP